MERIVRGVIAGLMLLGLVSAVAIPKNPKHNGTVLVAGGGGPMPTCDPSDPACPPPIPPAR